MLSLLSGNTAYLIHLQRIKNSQKIKLINKILTTNKRMVVTTASIGCKKRGISDVNVGKDIR